MLTKLTVRNFKQFDDIAIELDDVAVFVGPNDSGKTTALQAIALWDLGLRRWRERWGMVSTDDLKRPGVSINRQDLLAVPVRQASLLWRGLRTRESNPRQGNPGTANVRIDIILEGVANVGNGSGGIKKWTCGLEFDYANPESFYCRPMRTSDGRDRMPIPPEAFQERVVFLTPMSGLSSSEVLLQPGAVNVLLGEGRTAEVIRNLCYEVSKARPRPQGRLWNDVLVPQMQKVFGATVMEPVYNPERGEITLSYKDAYMQNLELDLSSSGRGFQQTLLLTAYMLLNPNSIILLDEPDAHLEILRQREIYQSITETATRQNSQLIIATHSEVVLNEAAERHAATAFIGTPHRILGGSAQVRKSLAEIGYEHYLQAGQTGWALYLEGSTDLSILRAFAKRLGHQAQVCLERPYVHYVGNQPMQARSHFWGLREALPDLRGYALFDRLNLPDGGNPSLKEHSWEKREIENYFCAPEVLIRWTEATNPIFRQVMIQSIGEIEDALRRLNQGSPWDSDMKVSDGFLQPLFNSYYDKAGAPGGMRKTDYHFLIDHIEPNEIDAEVVRVLDDILIVSGKARPS